MGVMARLPLLMPAHMVIAPFLLPFFNHQVNVILYLTPRRIRIRPRVTSQQPQHLSSAQIIGLMITRIALGRVHRICLPLRTLAMSMVIKKHVRRWTCPGTFRTVHVIQHNRTVHKTATLTLEILLQSKRERMSGQQTIVIGSMVARQLRRIRAVVVLTPLQ